MVGLFRFVCFVLVCIARKIWEISYIYIYAYIISSDWLLSALVLTFCLLVNIPCRFKTLFDWVTMGLSTGLVYWGRWDLVRFYLTWPMAQTLPNLPSTLPLQRQTFADHSVTMFDTLRRMLRAYLRIYNTKKVSKKQRKYRGKAVKPVKPALRKKERKRLFIHLLN